MPPSPCPLPKGERVPFGEYSLPVLRIPLSLGRGVRACPVLDTGGEGADPAARSRSSVKRHPNYPIHYYPRTVVFLSPDL